ncbi:MAG TPA: FAD-binding oxidoreductase [Solirubrobacteraceae bacterium]|nr:FAD-binding oxidoreductase [Solirubrobacteraceae bacterium]
MSSPAGNPEPLAQARPDSAGGYPSFWLDREPPGPSRPALSGREEADVCIVGGGFTGLWAAYELKRAAPELRVTVLEARHVGFGASGRNGGWAVGIISGSPAAWRRRGGTQAPRRMLEAIQATVAEIGQAVEREAIDCDWHHGGSLAVAQNATQRARLEAGVSEQRSWAGEACALQLLSADELQARINVAGASAGMFNPHCARIQPAKLVRGLAAAAERAGVVVHESSPVVDVVPRLVRTAAGHVSARQVIVACEGYTANLPRRHRWLLPLNSSMIVTEPLSPEIWQHLGWEGAETLLDGSHAYTYSQRTADGRIAIGGRGVPYRFGSKTDREGPVPSETVEELRHRLAAMFPVLGDVGVTRAWHGVLGVSRDWCPWVSYDPASGLGFAGGYAGDGVAASNLAGRTLRDLLLERDTPLSTLPWVNTPPRAWEPEPFRYAGARGIYALYRKADRQEELSDRPARLAAVADLIAGR